MSWRSMTASLVVVTLVGAGVGYATVAAPDREEIPVIGDTTAAGQAGTAAAGDVVQGWSAACPGMVQADQRREIGAATSVSLGPTGQGDGPGTLSVRSLPSGVGDSTDSADDVISVQAEGENTIEALAEGGLASGAAAVRSLTDSDGEGRGLAAATCPAADDNFWFVGVGASPGQRDTLLVHNPTASAAVVGLEFRSNDGLMAIPGNDDFAVQPGETVRVPLDARIPNRKFATMQVNTRTGLVSAMVLSTSISGLVPQGAAFLPPSARPSSEVIIPAGPKGSQRTALVIASGKDSVDVQIEAITADGVVPVPGRSRASIASESSKAFLLEELPAGSVAIRLRANGPIMAAARFEARQNLDAKAPGALDENGLPLRPEQEEPSADFAWIAGTDPVNSVLVLPLADLVAPTEVAVTALGGPTKVRIAVQWPGRPGSVQEVQVAGNRTVATKVSVPAGRGPGFIVVSRIEGSARFVAAIAQRFEPGSGPYLTAWSGQQVSGRVALPATTPIPLSEQG